MPDANARQWIINICKYLSMKTSHCDVNKWAKALDIEARDLLACVQDTASNAVRQLIRRLYPTQKLLSMKGPEVSKAQRSIIRGNELYSLILKDHDYFLSFIEFAESQRGPMSNHQFNEAVNGVFRSEKNELKKKQKASQSINSSQLHQINKKSEFVGQQQTNQVVQSTSADNDQEDSNDM